MEKQIKAAINRRMQEEITKQQQTKKEDEKHHQIRTEKVSYISHSSKSKAPGQGETEHAEGKRELWIDGIV